MQQSDINSHQCYGGFCTNPTYAQSEWREPTAKEYGLLLPWCYSCFEVIKQGNPNNALQFTEADFWRELSE